MTAYLEIEDALQVVDRYGFQIRDVGLLASALTRPATTVRGAEAYPELAVKAAALLESVARFHPLLDGNKRTAWTIMVLLLWINGYRHNFTTDEGFRLVVGVAAGCGLFSLGGGMPTDPFRWRRRSTQRSESDGCGYRSMRLRTKPSSKTSTKVPTAASRRSLSGRGGLSSGWDPPVCVAYSPSSGRTSRIRLAIRLPGLDSDAFAALWCIRCRRGGTSPRTVRTGRLGCSPEYRRATRRSWPGCAPARQYQSVDQVSFPAEH